MRDKAKKKIREDARKHLNVLLVSSGNKCYYCGIDIIRRNRLKEVIFEDKETVVYLNKGIHFGNIASVDHKKPLSLGGSNEVSNLVVACNKCNQLKSSDLNFKVPKHKDVYILKYKTNLSIDKLILLIYNINSKKILYKYLEDELVEVLGELFLIKKDEIRRIDTIREK